MYKEYEEQNPAAIIIYNLGKEAVAIPENKNDDKNKKEEDTELPSFFNKIEESEGKAVATLDADYGNAPAVLTNFLVTGINEQVQSIAKVAQHFGGNWNVFFFGESPTMMTLTGKLLDSPDAPHYEGFRSLVGSHLLGGSPAAAGFKVVLIVDSRVITGYFMSCQFGSSADNVRIKDFSFSLLVRSSRFIRRVSDRSLLLGRRPLRNMVVNE